MCQSAPRLLGRCLVADERTSASISASNAPGARLALGRYCLDRDRIGPFAAQDRAVNGEQHERLDHAEDDRRNAELFLQRRRIGKAQLQGLEIGLAGQLAGAGGQ